MVSISGYSSNYGAYGPSGAAGASGSSAAGGPSGGAGTSGAGGPSGGQPRNTVTYNAKPKLAAKAPTVPSGASGTSGGGQRSSTEIYAEMQEIQKEIKKKENERDTTPNWSEKNQTIIPGSAEKKSAKQTEINKLRQQLQQLQQEYNEALIREIAAENPSGT